MMFSGLMSRCTIARPCAAESALAIWLAISIDVAHRERPRCETLPQGLTLHQFGHHERPAVDLTEIVDHQDVRMIERRRGADFAVKAAEPLGVAGEPRRQQFECHRPVEPRVMSPIDLAHAAGPNPCLDAIRADDSADDVIGRGVQLPLDRRR